jgi:hypothetical protein
MAESTGDSGGTNGCYLSLIIAPSLFHHAPRPSSLPLPPSFLLHSFLLLFPILSTTLHIFQNHAHLPHPRSLTLTLALTSFLTPTVTGKGLRIFRLWSVSTRQRLGHGYLSP